MSSEEKAAKIQDVINIIREDLSKFDPASLNQSNIGRWGRLTSALRSLEEILPFYGLLEQARE